MFKKVLIVEDEIFVALEIEQIVEDAGFAVQAIAADRDAAMDSAAGCDIALVDRLCCITLDEVKSLIT